MTIGMLRVKNESRWIERSINSLLPVCDRIAVLDDHSEDSTAFLCATMPRTDVFDSPFAGLDESRDKNYLLDKLRPCRPDWIICIDGDEALEPSALELLSDALERPVQCYTLPILYLWDDEQHYRTDGVYGRMLRPSVFRPTAARYQPTPYGGNLHCGNVPVGSRGDTVMLPAKILHYGYMLKADRIRKYEFYRRVDPANRAEDEYRHIAQGDLPELPAAAAFKHAGPLTLCAV